VPTPPSPLKIYLLGDESEEGIESKVSMAVYTG